MPKIRTLSEDVVAKTAAGEVVERPASVVKELVENSLDAGASQIKIEVEESGMGRIQVIDDGEGMDKGDVIECLKPHTTSKIFYVDDLGKITSLGFRGEALNSIAAVSRLTVKSRKAESTAGYLLETEGGKIKRQSPAGMPYGTVIEVKDLFFNTPARKKFLKSSRTEFRHILETVIKAAMSHPETGFSLSHGKKVFLNLPKEQPPEERINSILGNQIFSKMIPINETDTYFEISGYIALPQIAAENQRDQYLFVNKRCVKNPLVSSLVKSAYKTLLEPRAHPSFILFIKTPVEMVDVNIHPRKEEIAFYDEKSLSEFITDTITEALEKSDLTYETDYFGSLIRERGADPYAFHVLKNSVEIWEAREKDLHGDGEILQVHNLYLIKETRKGITLIDQHAAHERILYEQFLEAFEKQRGFPYRLSKPCLLELTYMEADLLRENLEVFGELGFSIEEFGENTFKISEVPELLKEQEPDGIIREVLADLSEGKKPRKINSKSLRTISYLACRSAIKAGEYLNQEERKKLLEKLAQTKTKYTCPHGRPVEVEIPLRQLARTFRRLK